MFAFRNLTSPAFGLRPHQSLERITSDCPRGGWYAVGRWRPPELHAISCREFACQIPKIARCDVSRAMRSLTSKDPTREATQVVGVKTFLPSGRSEGGLLVIWSFGHFRFLNAAGAGRQKCRNVKKHKNRPRRRRNAHSETLRLKISS